MRRNIMLLGLGLILALTSCKKDKVVIPNQPSDGTDRVTTGLKDIVWHGLPSPYYHFEYDGAGFITIASFASNDAHYEVAHLGKRISHMQSTKPANKTRLEYEYSDNKVSLVKYLNDADQTVKRCFPNYNENGQLVSLDWEKAVAGGGFAQERSILLTYYADGNLKSLVNHRYKIEGQQTAMSTTDSFSDYDNKVNVDAFALIHPTGDHLLLLPSVKLQVNNPGKVIRRGDGVHYDISFQYVYDAASRPTRKNGDMFFLTGTDAGKHFNLQIDLNYW